ncbi:hypothetical protein [Polyangium spumosum]|uniref:3D domain-containing protein n=1 Tax=Polyangium spumosum TaxID=889282 RepID=A0A6N7PV58_9BACT|nr:hypothetical protein [Polyangium spumosum]MRG94320.1 hypothetical protein [Polyangium spumosum]
MSSKFKFCKTWTRGSITYTARGRGMDGLYGGWEATITGDAEVNGVRMAVTITMVFSIPEEGEGALVGTCALRSGLDLGPVTSSLTLDTPVRGTARLIGGKEKPTLTLVARGEAVAGRAEAFGPNMTVDMPLSAPGSEETLTFEVAPLHASLSIPKNKFDDELPIIPTDAQVKGDRVLYRQRIEVKVVRQEDGEAIDSVDVELKSSRSEDEIKPKKTKTDGEGKAEFTVETRERGEATFRVESKEASSDELPVPFEEAWYESLFRVTGYHYCLEEELGGELVEAQGLSGKHGKRFLFHRRGVATQGTGIARDGKYVHVTNGGTLKFKGQWLEAPEKARFKKDDHPGGSTRVPPTPGVTAAGDFTIVPKLHYVWIGDSKSGRVVGVRQVADVGYDIKGPRLDCFLGTGQAVVDEWMSQGGDLKFKDQKTKEVHPTAKVKYLGPKGPAQKSPENPPEKSPSLDPGPSAPDGGVDTRSGHLQRAIGKVSSYATLYPSLHLEVEQTRPILDEKKRTFSQETSSFAADIQGDEVHFIRRGTERGRSVDADIYMVGDDAYRVVEGQRVAALSLFWALWPLDLIAPLTFASSVATFQRHDILDGRRVEVHRVDSEAAPSLQKGAAMAAMGMVKGLLMKDASPRSVRGELWVDPQADALVRVTLDYEVEGEPAKKGRAAPIGEGRLTMAVSRIGQVEITLPPVA